MNIIYYRDGDRVELSSLGYEQGLTGEDNSKYKKTTTGVVIGDQRGNIIKVLRDHRKTPANYHVSFWKLCWAMEE